MLLPMNKEVFEMLSILSVELKVPVWELLERRWSELLLQIKMLKHYYEKVGKVR